MVTIGQNILRERLKKDITQAELARRSGISQPNLSAIETGTRDLTIRTMQSIAQALGVPPGSFFDEEPGAPLIAPAALNRFTLDRLARLTVGQRVSAKPHEIALARDLAFIMQSKIGAFLHLPKKRQNARDLHEVHGRLKNRLGANVFENLIRRVEKNLVSYA